MVVSGYTPWLRARDDCNLRESMPLEGVGPCRARWGFFMGHMSSE